MVLFFAIFFITELAVAFDLSAEDRQALEGGIFSVKHTTTRTPSGGGHGHDQGHGRHSANPNPRTNPPRNSSGRRYAVPSSSASATTTAKANHVPDTPRPVGGARTASSSTTSTTTAEGYKAVPDVHPSSVKNSDEQLAPQSAQDTTTIIGREQTNVEDRSLVTQDEEKVTSDRHPGRDALDKEPPPQELPPVERGQHEPQVLEAEDPISQEHVPPQYSEPPSEEEIYMLNTDEMLKQDRTARQTLNENHESLSHLQAADNLSEEELAALLQDNKVSLFSMNKGTGTSGAARRQQVVLDDGETEIDQDFLSPAARRTTTTLEGAAGTANTGSSTSSRGQLAGARRPASAATKGSSTKVVAKMSTENKKNAFILRKVKCELFVSHLSKDPRMVELPIECDPDDVENLNGYRICMMNEEFEVRKNQERTIMLDRPRPDGLELYAPILFGSCGAKVARYLMVPDRHEGRGMLHYQVGDISIDPLHGVFLYVSVTNLHMIYRVPLHDSSDRGSLSRWQGLGSPNQPHHMLSFDGFSSPIGLCALKNYEILVADSANNRVTHNSWATLPGKKGAQKKGKLVAGLRGFMLETPVQIAVVHATGNDKLYNTLYVVEKSRHLLRYVGEGNLIPEILQPSSGLKIHVFQPNLLAENRAKRRYFGGAGDGAGSSGTVDYFEMTKRGGENSYSSKVGGAVGADGRVLNAAVRDDSHDDEGAEVLFCLHGYVASARFRGREGARGAGGGISQGGNKSWKKSCLDVDSAGRAVVFREKSHLFNANNGRRIAIPSNIEHVVLSPKADSIYVSSKTTVYSLATDSVAEFFGTRRTGQAVEDGTILSI
ncbi:unnamed protein product [Amoebophrya sp. A120]|nr:unnamed protein product [Amoebophrya sp. A120]|eukprot:GSA120T00016533001.1